MRYLLKKLMTGCYTCHSLSDKDLMRGQLLTLEVYLQVGRVKRRSDNLAVKSPFITFRHNDAIAKHIGALSRLNTEGFPHFFAETSVDSFLRKTGSAIYKNGSVPNQ